MIKYVNDLQNVCGFLHEFVFFLPSKLPLFGHRMYYLWTHTIILSVSTNSLWYWILSVHVIINILPLVEGVTVDYHNTLNQRQYVLYYTECPSEGGIVEGDIAEGGIAGCGIFLFWWAGLRKVREKYHIYIYQWNWRIIKEICIKYNIYKYILLVSEGYLTVLETGILLK